MALLFMDGFDKYGGANSNATTVSALMAGEWSSVTSAEIVAPLSATGQAVASNGTMVLTKQLSSALGRIIGGFRFSATISTNCGIQFLDSVNPQCGIEITATTGIISLRSGSYNSGTIIGSSTAGVAANTTHYLEWDITLGTSSPYTIYLDGVVIITGTGHTNGTANTTYSGFQLNAGSGIGSFTVDDLYLFDNTTSQNNAVLLTSPRIETTFPTSDSTVQFSVGASILGTAVPRTASLLSTAANQFYLRPFTPTRACTLTGISLTTGTGSSGTANIRPIAYSDSAGLPGTLLSAGSTQTGLTANTTYSLPLTTAQTLSAGTQYWLGYMIDTAITSGLTEADTNASGRIATATFTSGAPGTAPTTTAGSASALIWGNITLSSAVNYYEVSNTPPPQAGISYVESSTVNQEDLYNFANLVVTPATIYGVGVKAWCEKSDSGTRTVSMRMSSSGVDAGGSLTGQAPGTSNAWLASYFPQDPNVSGPWTQSTLNAALTGFKIDS